jgi:acyl-CoA thioesterase FadM
VFVGTRLRPHSILTDRFTLEHVVVSEKHNRVAAEGSGTIVAFDYVGTRAKTNVPKEIVAAMLELERQHAK